MAEMRTDEGKGGRADYGLKPNMAKAKSRVGDKKADLAGRMKNKGMPYTQSTQDGSFDQSRGMPAKQWGSRPDFARGGGMPYKFWGPDAKVAGAKKTSK